MSASFMSIFLAQQQFHEIAPRLITRLSDMGDFSGELCWTLPHRFNRLVVQAKAQAEQPPKLPRDIALEELELITGEIETTNPYCLVFASPIFCGATSPISTRCR